jgi:competence protein ComEA
MFMIERREILILLFLIILIISGLLLFWQNAKHEIIITELNDDINLESKSFIDEEKKNKEAEEDRKIIIHIVGEVKRAGVYELYDDSRVIDALKAAGGETEKADLNSINLAAPIFDGDKIFVPSINIAINEDGNAGLEMSEYISGKDNDKININRASVEELQALSGIGPSKAENIIKYREENGKFKELNELLNVNGIGEKTLENIKDKLTLR